MKPYPIQARPWVQILFSLVVIFIGVKFYPFVSCIEKGVIPDFERPAGVEAFLPIGALVGLKHLLYTGTINRIHPSGLVLFLMIIFTAVFAKKGFCSWICPIGTLSEYLYRGRRLLFQKPFKMPMDGTEQLIQSPYNRFADIHMLKFFTRMSATALYCPSFSGISGAGICVPTAHCWESSAFPAWAISTGTPPIAPDAANVKKIARG
jgi:hypothetical protein